MHAEERTTGKSVSERSATGLNVKNGFAAEENVVCTGAGEPVVSVVRGNAANGPGPTGSANEVHADTCDAGVERAIMADVSEVENAVTANGVNVMGKCEDRKDVNVDGPARIVVDGEVVHGNGADDRVVNEVGRAVASVVVERKEKDEATTEEDGAGRPSMCAAAFRTMRAREEADQKPVDGIKMIASAEGVNRAGRTNAIDTVNDGDLKTGGMMEAIHEVAPAVDLLVEQDEGIMAWATAGILNPPETRRSTTDREPVPETPETREKPDVKRISHPR